MPLYLDPVHLTRYVNGYIDSDLQEGGLEGVDMCGNRFRRVYVFWEVANGLWDVVFGVYGKQAAVETSRQQSRWPECTDSRQMECQNKNMSGHSTRRLSKKRPSEKERTQTHTIEIEQPESGLSQTGGVKSAQ